MGILLHKWVNVVIHLLVFAALSFRWLRSVVVVVVVHLPVFAGFVMVRRCLASRCAVHSLNLRCARARAVVFRI